MGGKAILVGCALAGVVLAGGCSSSKNPPHLAQNPTFAKECSDVWTSLCQRAVGDCTIYAYGTTPKDCVDANATKCCGSVCNTVAGSTQGQIDQCRSALSEFSCDALAQDQLPQQCDGVIRY